MTASGQKYAISIRGKACRKWNHPIQKQAVPYTHPHDTKCKQTTSVLCDIDYSIMIHMYKKISFVFASYADEVERWIYPLPITYRQEKGHPVFAGRAIGISEPEDPALTET